MRVAKVYLHNTLAGTLTETEFKKNYVFEYDAGYDGPVVSVTLPKGKVHEFNRFPPFFEGLLPEGENLEALLKTMKIDRQDYFGQLVAVGQDTVGAASILPEESE